MAQSKSVVDGDGSLANSTFWKNAEQGADHRSLVRVRLADPFESKSGMAITSLMDWNLSLGSFVPSLLFYSNLQS